MRFCCNAFSEGGGPNRVPCETHLRASALDKSCSLRKRADQPDRFRILEYDFEHMSRREDFVIIPILVMTREKEPSFVFNYLTEMIPTVSKLLMVTEAILIDIAPESIIDIVANRVEQFAVVIIRKIDEIRNEICRVVGVALDNTADPRCPKTSHIHRGCRIRVEVLPR